VSAGRWRRRWLRAQRALERRLPAPLRAIQARAVARAFHRLFYYGVDGAPVFSQVRWLGVPALKCPLDLWQYQELVFETRPDVIVETGVYRGGTTLFLASLCDLLGHGEVIGCDVALAPVAPEVARHPRIALVEGSSTAPEVFARIRARCAGRRALVILDSDHSERHVAEELRLYAELVAPGGLLICEDTNVNGNPVFPTFGPGPAEAVERFLAERPDWQADRRCERLLLTFSPGGWLRRRPS
jgi:cephalosporin hydroxylase